MKIRDRQEGNVTIVEPCADLDDKNVRPFEEKIAELLHARRHRLVVDLREVDHVSAAGLRALLTLSKRLRASDGDLVLCALNDRVRETFDISGFTELFLIAPSPPEAIGLLQPERRRVSAVARLAAHLLGNRGRAGRDAERFGGPQSAISDKSHRIAELAESILSRGDEGRDRRPAAAVSHQPPERAETPLPTRKPDGTGRDGTALRTGDGFARARRKIGRWMGGRRP